eukprot:jgi/Pico_ML_1/52854/g3498.t1
MPASQAFKESVLRFKTLLVNKFKTAMVHARDGSVMKQVWSKREHATARGLMWCGSTNGKFANRNLNAALNIRRCLALSVRPTELCRAALAVRPHKVVGNVIRC